MARYSDPPKGYDPGLRLQLRLQLEGGGLRPNVLQLPQLAPGPRPEIVVMVHGFNNHYGEAGAAYFGFRQRQYTKDPNLAPPALEKILADMFWPGDAAWGMFDLADFLVYPAAVGTAQEAAPLLAEYLRTLPTLRLVHFVAHSLGCRVVLETIDDLRRKGGPPVGKVCLMAAAVPVFKVQLGGSLAEAMEHAAEVRVLHSDNDLVLRYTFAPGQTVAKGDEGFFPTALGLHGPPHGVPGRVDQRRIEGAGHSDYWGHSSKPAADKAAARIAEFFKFGSRQRILASQSPGAPRRTSTDQPRQLGYTRAIRGRS